jgi:glucose-1-phosphate adenylyltransferase
MDQITYSTPLARSAMAYVLAGGRGSRLMELTENRAKPAVYFGGKTRIIDFALSNALNSGIRRIAVATQYKAHSLIRHLQRGWNFLQPMRNESFDILPASQRVAENQWYMGTADAVYQNVDIIDGYASEYIVVLAGDHVYKMDYERMLVQHVNDDADVTVGAIEVSIDEARSLGVMHVDTADRIVGLRRETAASGGNAGPAGAGARQHGHLRFPAPVPHRPAAARCGRSAFVARFRARRHSLHREARQGRRASLRAVVRAFARRA